MRGAPSLYHASLVFSLRIIKKKSSNEGRNEKIRVIKGSREREMTGNKKNKEKFRAENGRVPVTISISMVTRLKIGLGSYDCMMYVRMLLKLSTSINVDGEERIEVYEPAPTHAETHYRDVNSSADILCFH